MSHDFEFLRIDGTTCTVYGTDRAILVLNIGKMWQHKYCFALAKFATSLQTKSIKYFCKFDFLLGPKILGTAVLKF